MSRASEILEKIWVDPNKEVSRIFTSQVRANIKRVLLKFKELHDKGHDIPMALVVKGLNKMSGLSKHRITFELKQVEYQPGLERFIFWDGFSKTDYKDPGKNEIFIEVNPYFKFSWLDAQRLKENLDGLESIIVHELTHRIQYGTISTSKLLGYPIVRTIAANLMRSRGSRFKRDNDQKYLGRHVEVSAYAQQIAHSITRNKDIWQGWIEQYAKFAAPKSTKLLVKKVYKTLRDGGMSDKEIAKATAQIDQIIKQNQPKKTPFGLPQFAR